VTKTGRCIIVHLKPNAGRILMDTRWHEEDAAGRILYQIQRAPADA
jgi:hypothetical protein